MKKQPCRALKVKSKDAPESTGQWCAFHDPARAEAQKRDRALGGETASHRRRSRLDRPGALHREFKSPEDVRALLGDVANELAQGKLALNVAQEIRRTCADMLKTFGLPEVPSSSGVGDPVDERAHIEGMLGDG